MSAAEETIGLNFNANAVAHPAQRAAQFANEFVTFAANAIGDASLEKEPEARNPAFFHAKMPGPQRTEDERRDAYLNWVMVRGLQDLSRGVKRSLEEAYLYVEGRKLVGRKMKLAELAGFEAQVRKRANRKDFGQIMSLVNPQLKEPLSFEEEFKSLQKIRNVLEHRDGIVGVQDLGERETLDLLIPRIGLFYMKDGQETEITGPTGPFPADTAMYIKRASPRKRSYKLGEQTKITGREFNEVAFACHLFAADLANKLPDIAVTVDKAASADS
ncbi:hypothetical protein QCM77_43890 [Bradyrhizobium sp. SSUT18]|uniref:hypothetical protein n=1 Tax=unclassified Bradyrhizobium TaxID=2631580 RepID=UPI002446C339|nr:MULTISPECIES: hypothetical protein [unclassified Bradyrhizobium]MDH2353749.1 hypothetical protein [Bradyrhizobium sp. SSUT112]MDH2406730.1 hypothetical protein [Bradyrhizobium sp. SSUT18]